MRTITAISLALVLPLLAAGCGAPGVPRPGPDTGAPTVVDAAALAGRYAGLIPCADCPGIRYTLTLLPGGRAVRQMTYLEAENGEDRTFTERLSWRVAEGGREVVLSGDDMREQRLRVVDAQTLRMLDAEGNPIRSGLNFDLARVDTTTAPSAGHPPA